MMSLMRCWNFVICALLLIPAVSLAKSVQEGWYKVSIGTQHAGFFVQRIDFDAGKKQWTMTTYLKTSALGGNIVESVQSVSGKDLAPVSYLYATQTPNEAKTIKAEFVGKKIQLKISKGDKTETKDVEYKPGIFWSSALLYVMLSSKEGLKVGNSFAYEAIAEEDGKVSQGTAVVSGEEEFRGTKCFKILNTFKGAKYVSIVSETGVIYSIRHPLDSLEVIMVDNRDDAVGSISVSESMMKTLFGTEPVKSMLPEMKLGTGKAKDSGAALKVEAPKAEAPKAEGTSDAPKKLSAPSGDAGDASKVPEGLSVPAGKGK